MHPAAWLRLFHSCFGNLEFADACPQTLPTDGSFSSCRSPLKYHLLKRCSLTTLSEVVPHTVTSQLLLVAFRALTTIWQLIYLDACLFVKPKHSVSFTITSLAQHRTWTLQILAEWRNQRSMVISMQQMLTKCRLTELLGIRGEYRFSCLLFPYFYMYGWFIHPPGSSSRKPQGHSWNFSSSLGAFDSSTAINFISLVSLKGITHYVLCSGLQNPLHRLLQ